MVTAEEAQDALVKAYVDDLKKDGYWRNDREATYLDELLSEYELSYGIIKSPLESPIGVFEGVEDFGGEGLGETRYFVVSLTDPDGEVQYFRADGYYASWDGDNWDGAKLYEVEAVPVQKIEYRRKK